jgi:hypothetical protein
MKINKTQTERILKHLESGKSLTQMQALNLFDSFRLSGIIHRLRRRGYLINTKMIRVDSGKYIAEYSLKREKKFKYLRKLFK